MSRSALLLLLFAACAAPQQRRELRDGAPMRTPVVEPRTTYTPTGAGLSEYWAEPDAPKPERSPYTRVLPQTPETMKGPGIWAAKDPEDGGLVLLGVLVPLPPSAKDDTRAVVMANACVQSMGSTAAEVGVAPLPEWISSDARKCLALLLYHQCVFWRTKTALGTNAVAESPLVSTAAREAQAACRGVPRDEYERAYNGVMKMWKERNVPHGNTSGL